jgi:hypothetical protein
MKKSGSSKMNVILALLAVLIVSVGYLAMQHGKEGMEDKMPAKKPVTKEGLTKKTA